MTSDSESNTVAGDVAAGATSENSAARRQRAYRQRRKRAALEAIGEEASASRVALLTLLAQDLAALEARVTPATMIGPTRSSVRRILTAIVTRYGIEL